MRTSHDRLDPEPDVSARPKPLAPGHLAEAMPLREVLQGIGEVWQLPKRPPTLPGGAPVVNSGVPAGSRNTVSIPVVAPAASPGGPSVAAQRAHGRISAAWWAIGIALTASMVWWAWQPPALPSDPMPDAMRGTWRTTHPDYVHSAMIFSDTVLTIRTVDPNSGAPNSTDAARTMTMTHRIMGLRAVVRGDTADVTLTYDDAGERTELSARLVDGPIPVLMFSRPEGLTWRHEANMP